MNIYVAAGWFSPEQMKACKEVEALVYSADFCHFFPRQMNLGTDGCDWEQVFSENIKRIDDCDIIVASTVGKDMGTLWECGYGFAKGKDIIYYTPGIKKPNLMLAHSGQIATNLNELEACIFDPEITFCGEEIE